MINIIGEIDYIRLTFVLGCIFVCKSRFTHSFNLLVIHTFVIFSEEMDVI